MLAAIANAVHLSSDTFTLRVGDIATRVVCDEPDLTLTLSDTRSRFLVSGCEPDVTIRVQRAPHLRDPSGDKLFDSGAVWRLFREGSEFVFSFVSTAGGPAPYRLVRVNASFTSGTIWVGTACLVDGAAIAPLEYPLDELLMINLLGKGRGVEVHACGVIDRDGSAYVFAGQSEAGKSTISRLWRDEGATVLSDDRLVLRLRDGQVWVYGTPWHGDAEFACPASAPLTRLFFLRHGSEQCVRRTGGAGATARLFTCCFPPFHDEAGIDFTLDLLTSILDRVPCFELTFVPDSSVVSFVRAHS
jgi:hypothetical protein